MKLYLWIGFQRPRLLGPASSSTTPLATTLSVLNTTSGASTRITASGAPRAR